MQSLLKTLIGMQSNSIGIFLFQSDFLIREIKSECRVKGFFYSLFFGLKLTSQRSLILFFINETLFILRIPNRILMESKKIFNSVQ